MYVKKVQVYMQSATRETKNERKREREREREGLERGGSKQHMKNRISQHLIHCIKVIY